MEVERWLRKGNLVEHTYTPHQMGLSALSIQIPFMGHTISMPASALSQHAPFMGIQPLNGYI